MENINVEKCDVKDVMNEIKMVGNPIDKLDFWFYAEEIGDEDGNPTVFHAYEGTGDNLLYEDIEQGFVDYINYETYDGKITYSMIDAYGQGEDLDTMRKIIDAQSLLSVPPAPGLIDTIALPLSLGPLSMRRISRRLIPFSASLSSGNASCTTDKSSASLPIAINTSASSSLRSCAASVSTIVW